MLLISSGYGGSIYFIVHQEIGCVTLAANTRPGWRLPTYIGSDAPRLVETISECRRSPILGSHQGIIVTPAFAHMFCIRNTSAGSWPSSQSTADAVAKLVHDNAIIYVAVFLGRPIP